MDQIEELKKALARIPDEGAINKAKRREIIRQIQRLEREKK